MCDVSPTANSSGSLPQQVSHRGAISRGECVFARTIVTENLDSCSGNCPRLMMGAAGGVNCMVTTSTCASQVRPGEEGLLEARGATIKMLPQGNVPRLHTLPRLHRSHGLSYTGKGGKASPQHTLNSSSLWRCCLHLGLCLRSFLSGNHPHCWHRKHVAPRVSTGDTAGRRGEGATEGGVFFSPSPPRAPWLVALRKLLGLFTNPFS